jgi:flavin reductase (DIM6/NTAB) family NADH-FMN oxidoreductase RutF
MPEPGPFQDPLQKIVDRLDYPMAVVTAAADGERSGCLVGFHTQCSLDPPRFLVCISRQNHTFAVAARSAQLAVHLLDRDDHALATLFGARTGDEVDKFAACDWREVHGVPVLAAVRAWFVGRVLERVPLGDHVGHLLEPVEAQLSGELRQLAFQRVKSMRPGHPA